jgi:hypothetical protein
MKARILCSASPRSGSSAVSTSGGIGEKCPAIGAGHSCSAAVAPDPGLRGWANHDDSPPVRGDSVKAEGPFGGAVGKTLRCGQWHTLRAREAESGVILRPCGALN